MIRLYSDRCSGNAYKILLALAQLGRPFEEIAIDIFRGESRTPAFFTKNPDGRIPVLETDGGRFLAESNAILAYLAEGTPLLPSDPLERAQVLAWLFFEQNQIEPNLGTARYWMLTGKNRGLEAVQAQKTGASERALETLARGLDGKTFLVAERYTIADVGVYAYAHLAPDIGLALPPPVAAWAARVEGVPGWFPGPAPYPPHARA